MQAPLHTYTHTDHSCIPCSRSAANTHAPKMPKLCRRHSTHTRTQTTVVYRARGRQQTHMRQKCPSYAGATPHIHAHRPQLYTVLAVGSKHTCAKNAQAMQAPLHTYTRTDHSCIPCSRSAANTHARPRDIVSTLDERVAPPARVRARARTHTQPHALIALVRLRAKARAH